MTWLLLGAFICMILLRISQAFDKVYSCLKSYPDFVTLKIVFDQFYLLISAPLQVPLASTINSSPAKMHPNCALYFLFIFFCL